MVERIVGLDIGTSALRAVELVVEDGHPPVLEAFGQVGLPPGVVADGEIRDRAQVTSAIRRLWRNGGFKTNRVRLGVAGLRAITREIELPLVPPEEVTAAVTLQAEDIVPFPIDRTSLASAVISRTEDADGLPLIGVMVAAAHRDVIDGVVAAVEDAGLEPEGIDLGTAALSRAFTLPGGESEPEAVVSVGAGLTMVVVHHGGTLQFVRTIDSGGDAVTRALASALDIPIADAELVKRRLAGPGRHDPDAIRVVGGVVGQLADDVKSSLRYFSTVPGRTQSVVRVLVTGGGARTVGLLDELRARIDVPVLEASPLSFVDVSRLKMTPGEAESINQIVAVPLGLALNGPARTRFELIPPEIAAKPAMRRRRRALILAGVVVLLALAGASAWRVLAVRTAERQVATLQSTIHTINTVEMPRYDKAVRLGNEVTSLQHQLQPLVAHEVDWLVVLNQLGEYLPSSAVMSGLNLTASQPTGGTIGTTAPVTTSIIGNGTTTVSTHSLTQVTQFGLAMARSPGLSSVDLSGSVSASTTGDVSFPITFAINTRAHSQRVSLFEEKLP
ncbi:MAG TPA: type IV pilus assembly protein PilM [Acidimicrobiales bacterium]|nr:type IV pilus assembly protein PilM [Acidimicrobiales bacterium]